MRGDAAGVSGGGLLVTSLAGKTALVTGGSRGIGRGIALALAEAGALVVLTYHRQWAVAEETVWAIERAGGFAYAVQMTLQEPASVTHAMHAAAQWGSVDILVNNAAMVQEKTFELLTVSDWQVMLAANLIGPVLCCQAVLPAMQAQHRGRIVNIASISGQIGGVLQPQYAASKAALINLTKSLARLYAKDGITVNAVAPGLVNTDMIQQELATEDGQKKVASIPMGRIAQPEEVAAAVAWLCSEEAGYVTGQTLSINGGMLML